MKLSKAWRTALIVLALTVIGATANAYLRGRPAGSKETSQDIPNLDRRVSMLEQRLSFIETNIYRLEQQTTRVAPSVEGRDPEVQLLRREVELLQQQIGTIQCGMARLDERTLSPTARERQRRAGTQSVDPCRLNPEAPLQLPSRP